MHTFDFERAMCVYLGGDPSSGGIQIGQREKRLSAEFGAEAAAIKAELDATLDAVVRQTAKGFRLNDDSIERWVGKQFPAASKVCSKKIASHAIYYHSH